MSIIKNKGILRLLKPLHIDKIAIEASTYIISGSLKQVEGRCNKSQWRR